MSIYKDLIDNMTLKEKVSLLSGKNYWETNNIDKYCIPSMFLADGPYGLRKQAVEADKIGLNKGLPATCFPTGSCVANSWNEELYYEIGKAIGEEAIANRVNIVLGPSINIKRNPLCGRNFEYLSEDPLLSGKMGASYIKGIQSQGISACVKHFACNNQETRRKAVDTIVDERAFREIYLKPFQYAVVEGKVKSIMASYNKINGNYACENFHLMTGILRNDWKFKGVTISDWGASNSRTKGLVAGNDLEMPSNCGETNKEIYDAVLNNKIPSSYVDQSATRLLKLAFSTTDAFKGKKNIFDVDKHNELALKAAEESIVLLKNNNVLPLNSKDKIAIIGTFAFKPRYQGAGSSIVTPTKLSSFVEVIKNYNLNIIGAEKGFRRFGKSNKILMDQALNLASNADKILLFLGLDEFSESEGYDRTTLDLPSNQLELINKLLLLKKEIIVILSCGSVVNLPFDSKINGLVHCYLSGQEGARALANILVNATNPSGKLAETYPLDYKDVPNINTFSKAVNSVEYRESIYIGYRYYSTKNIKVRYPFGFGLSYTNFSYSDLEIKNMELSFKLKNTGKYEGKEIIQVYYGLENSKIFRAKRSLMLYDKISLKPDEEVILTYKLKESMFQFFNTRTNSWEIEKGNYLIEIGSSSLNILLTESLKLEGTDSPIENESKELSKYYAGDVQNVSVGEFEYLIKRKVPNPNRIFFKKNRILVHSNTTIDELKYSKGMFGRFFHSILSIYRGYLRIFKKRDRENEITMGVLFEPIRTISRMTNGKISWGQLNALIMMFNGKFFKGVHMFFKEKRKKNILFSKYRKEN